MTDLSTLKATYERATHNTTFTFTGGSSGGTSSAVNLEIIKIGSQVFIWLPQTRAATGTSNTTFTMDTAIPTRFRSSNLAGSNTLSHRISISNNVSGFGLFRIDDLGVIRILVDHNGTAWVDSQGASGMTNSFSFSYSI